jgi:hypothetical protein
MMPTDGQMITQKASHFTAHSRQKKHSVFWRVGWICHFKARKGISTKHLEKWVEKDLGSNPKHCNLPQNGLLTYTTKGKRLLLFDW